MTQKEIIWHHIQIAPITSKIAWDKYGITRLSDIIYKLKKEGKPIAAKLIPVQNRQGGVSWVSRYEVENGKV